MKHLRSNHVILTAGVFIAVTIAALMLPSVKERKSSGYSAILPAPSTAKAAVLSSWTQAVKRVKEDRGEATGKQAKLEIPQQVRHYSDTRRFLATQVAEWREHKINTPQDFGDLAVMIRNGELVELEPVSENYILFGVGGSATKERFTRYQNGKSIPLYSEADVAESYARLAVSQTTLENELGALRRELGSLGKRDRSQRTRLQVKINEKEKGLKALREERETLELNYGDAEKRLALFRYDESLTGLAETYSFDIANPRERQQMKVRMLSHLRPEALKVLEEVAGSYRETFNRPLPITSLVRPDEYQHTLGKVNPNATRIETPPHSTGLAFDVNYRYMTAAEQSHVMEHLGRLKDEGRIEVLRENRDHYHVFAFIDGARPDESLIKASLRDIG